MAQPKHLIPTTTLIIGALSGILLSRYISPSLPTPSSTEAPEIKASEEIFSTRIATLQGEIVNIGKDTLQIKNKDGKLATFSLSPEANYINPNSRKASSASAELQALKPGSEVSLILRAEKGTYSISTITPMISPSPLPTATASSKPKR